MIFVTNTNLVSVLSFFRFKEISKEFRSILKPGMKTAYKHEFSQHITHCSRTWFRVKGYNGKLNPYCSYGTESNRSSLALQLVFVIFCLKACFQKIISSYE